MKQSIDNQYKNNANIAQNQFKYKIAVGTRHQILSLVTQQRHSIDDMANWVYGTEQ